jgi:hypothetical protein
MVFDYNLRNFDFNNFEVFHIHKVSISFVVNKLAYSHKTELVRICLIVFREYNY